MKTLNVRLTDTLSGKSQSIAVQAPDEPAERTSEAHWMWYGDVHGRLQAVARKQMGTDCWEVRSDTGGYWSSEY